MFLFFSVRMANSKRCTAYGSRSIFQSGGRNRMISRRETKSVNPYLSPLFQFTLAFSGSPTSFSFCAISMTR